MTDPSAIGQTWTAQSYASNAGFVPVLGQAALDLLAVRPGERILDLGCGDGVLTAALVKAGASVLGVDASRELIEAAAARGLDVRLADGQRLEFRGEFDAVFSNAALHWMPDAGAVVGGVRRALKPGGRFVGEFGGHGNVAAICTALIAALEAAGVERPERLPWFFPTVEEYRALLQQHGFRVEPIELIARPTPLPTGMAGWLGTFASPFLHGLDEAARQQVLADATAWLAPSLRDGAGNWTADYVRLRFKATL